MPLRADRATDLGPELGVACDVARRQRTPDVLAVVEWWLGRDDRTRVVRRSPAIAATGRLGNGVRVAGQQASFEFGVVRLAQPDQVAVPVDPQRSRRHIRRADAMWPHERDGFGLDRDLDHVTNDVL